MVCKYICPQNESFTPAKLDSPCTPIKEDSYPESRRTLRQARSQALGLSKLLWKKRALAGFMLMRGLRRFRDAKKKRRLKLAPCKGIRKARDSAITALSLAFYTFFPCALHSRSFNAYFPPITTRPERTRAVRAPLKLRSRDACSRPLRVL